MNDLAEMGRSVLRPYESDPRTGRLKIGHYESNSKAPASPTRSG
jgi:hypothetical protein